MRNIVHLIAVAVIALITGCAVPPQEKPQEIVIVPLPAAEQAEALRLESDKEYLAALRFWMDSRGLVDERIAVISDYLQEISRSHAEKGVALYEKGDGKKALQEFVLALRNDPTNSVALEYLQNKYTALQSVPYAIKDGDTFESIADAVYGNAEDVFAVAQFSGVTSEDGLVAGAVINLPLLDSMYSQALLDYKRDIIVARNLFNDKQYNQLLPLAEKILKEHPEDQEASYLLNSSLVGLGKQLRSLEKYEDAHEVLSRVDPVFKNVEQDLLEIRELQQQKLTEDARQLNEELFKKGELLISQKKYIEALQVLNEVDPDFEGVTREIANVKVVMKLQADVHYKKGVKFFIEENLTAAIGEWEKTLQLDPDHSKALENISQARQLLEKVKSIE